MKISHIAIVALAAIAFVGCTPRRSAYSQHPSQNYDNGGVSSVASDNIGGDLTDADSRSADEKVAAWINENNIPEEAKLCTIYFGFDRFSVDENARRQLDAIADAAQRSGIVIVGYSDYIGAEEYNLALSDKRAQAVKNYLNNIGSANYAKIHALGEQFAVQAGTKEEVANDRKVIVIDGNAAR